jgi:hypothetical protein
MTSLLDQPQDVVLAAAAADRIALHRYLAQVQEELLGLARRANELTDLREKLMRLAQSGG